MTTHFVRGRSYSMLRKRFVISHTRLTPM